MKLLPILALSAIAATPVLAEDSRQLDAHEHGVGQLDIAFDGDQIAMELHAPGADIVGFEYAAKSDEDRAAVDAALEKLATPVDLFALTKAAGCSVVKATAELESEDAHDEDHDDHKDDDHDEHGDEDGEHEDHADDDHGDEDGHTEFHAEYMLTCTNPSAITEISFAYFDVFPSAIEVEVQIITDTGATAFVVERDTPILDLRGKL